MSTVVDADVALLGFTRALRAAGVAVTQDRAQTFLRAVAAVGLDRPQATYWAGRATLCGSPEDCATYDKVFWAWFHDDGSTVTGERRQPPPPVQQAPLTEDDGDSGDGGEADVLHVAASDADILRHRDIATLDATERARLTRLFARLRPAPPRRTRARRSPRPRPAPARAGSRPRAPGSGSRSSGRGSGASRRRAAHACGSR